MSACWYEVRAYLTWLSAQTDLSFRLPTEVEWEAAACGLSSKRYPFGEDFEPKCCNTFEAHLRRTSPVGVFPDGDTSEKVADLSGNISEWTSSFCRPYPYDSADGRERCDGIGNRVLRGGSWFDSHDFARAAFRFDLPSAHLDGGRGFRLCCSSSILKS